MKIKCKSCNDIIFSKWQGQWVSCDCGRIFIDETAYYTRVGGSNDDYEVVDDTSSFSVDDRVLSGINRTEGGKTTEH